MTRDPASSHPLQHGRALVLSVLALCGSTAAQAAVTLLPPISSLTSRTLTLQVGSIGPRIDTVHFAVPNAPGTQGVPVTGASDGPASTPAGGVRIAIAVGNHNSLTVGTTSIRLTVDSSASLSCRSISCGSTMIPFNKISWVSYNKQATGALVGYDIQDGSFAGTTTQNLLRIDPAGNGGWAFSHYTLIPLDYGHSLDINNVLVFRYANDVIYPAGTYEGRVIYTAATF